jgi:Protein of unknown function (DUF3574)
MRIRPLLLALALTACAPEGEIETCARGEEARAVATMFFGRNIGGRLGVSEGEWDRFVDLQITPRFPDGLTVADGQGQWRDKENGSVVHEPSKIVTLILGADSEQARADIDAIEEAYKRQFEQQAVGLVIEQSCVSY